MECPFSNEIEMLRKTIKTLIKERDDYKRQMENWRKEFYDYKKLNNQWIIKERDFLDSKGINGNALVDQLTNVYKMAGITRRKHE